MARGRPLGTKATGRPFAKVRLIRGLFETHLEVADLDRAVAFYTGLGLRLAHGNARAAFLWIGEGEGRTDGQVLGLWLPASEPATAGGSAALGVRPRKGHLAFRVSLSDLERVPAWLGGMGLSLRAAFGRPPVEPIVHTWMPAAAVYADDPDGNELEWIAPLPGPPHALVAGPPPPYLSAWRRAVAAVPQVTDR